MYDVQVHSASREGTRVRHSGEAQSGRNAMSADFLTSGGAASCWTRAPPSTAAPNNASWRNTPGTCREVGLPSRTSLLQVRIRFFGRSHLGFEHFDNGSQLGGRISLRFDVQLKPAHLELADNDCLDICLGGLLRRIDEGAAPRLPPKPLPFHLVNAAARDRDQDLARSKLADGRNGILGPVLLPHCRRRNQSRRRSL